MEEKEKFEANKKSNAPFLRALRVLMKEKNLNQAQVAKLLNTKSGTFSDYKNGKKRASEEMYYRLDRAFGGRLNMHYLTGESEYMMLANVPDEEIAEYSMREGNPDYDLIKQRKCQEAQPTQAIENSFMLEKVLTTTVNEIKASKDKIIESLENQLKEKDERIAEQKRTIKLLEQKIEVLEAMQHIDANDPIKKYPFTIGVADKDDNISTRV